MVFHLLRQVKLLPAVALLIWAVGPAAALFNDDELSALDTEVLFDSEYFVDLRSFAYPAEWQDLWRGGGVGYRVNSASLDANDLFIEQDARLPKRLNDWFSFDYTVDHRGDKDVVRLHQWISLNFGPFRRATFSLFGEPKFAKENADIGLKVAYDLGKSASVFASLNAVDFSFNKRGRTTATYDKKPYTWLFGGKGRLGRDVFAGSLEIDTPLIRNIPADNRIYKYRSVKLAAMWRRPPQATGGWGWSGGYSYAFKRESDNFTPDPLSATQEFTRRVHLWHAAADKDLSEKHRVETGLDAMVRDGETDFANNPNNSKKHKRWELMPYGRWRNKVKPWGIAEVAVFLAFGERRQTFDSSAAGSQWETLVEAKLGLGWDFIYGPAGRLGLYGTFDIDDAGNHLWDGGNIRAMFLF